MMGNKRICRYSRYDSTERQRTLVALSVAAKLTGFEEYSQRRGRAMQHRLLPAHLQISHSLHYSQKMASSLRAIRTVARTFSAPSSSRALSSRVVAAPRALAGLPASARSFSSSRAVLGSGESMSCTLYLRLRFPLF